MPEMLLEVLSIMMSAAVATLLWWRMTEKRDDHDEQDRDR